MDNILNIIFNSRCLLCGEVGREICDRCLGSCNVLGKDFYLGMGQKAFCIFEYKESVSKCIRYSKYARKMFCALRVLTSFGISSCPLPDFLDYLVVPIPLGNKRYKSRGFNQAEIIARVLAEKIGLRVQNSILIRKKETAPQYDLGKHSRFENMKDAFYVSGSAEGKNILLVDDICTSGSTFVSASKVLCKVGAKDVKCFALSKKL